MARLSVRQVKPNAKALSLGNAKVYHLPDWHKLSHPQRLRVIRKIAMQRGRDPRIAQLAVSIIKDAGIQPRNYIGQADAILRWVQDPKNIYYVNEPGERLQDPIYTIKQGHADCFAEDTLVLRDDMDLVPIQDVRVGDRIWGKDRWSEVVNTWEKGKLPITEIGLNNGSVLRLTEGHKVYVRSCEKHGPNCPDIVGKRANCRHRNFEYVRIKVSELREGMDLLQPDQIEQPKGTRWIDAEGAWLLGAFVAEGWAESTRASISGKDGHWKEQTKHRVKEYAESRGWSTYWHDKYISINEVEAAAFLGECGRGAKNKHVPSWVLAQGNLEMLDEGLRLDASENSRGSGWTFGTISPTLAVQYRVLQRMLGRSTSCRLVTSHGGYGTNPIYRVGVRNPQAMSDKRLRVKTIQREVEEVPAYDIATDDHYVYLPEADCTVSNCDDQVLVLCALFESVGLPWKLVLSGRNAKGKIRHIEGQQVFPGTRWTHIYCMVGDRPFRPSTWYFAEPTVHGVPLGWDVVSGDHRYLPEMAKPTKGPARIAPSPMATPGHVPASLPPAGRRSPAYDAAYGSALIPVAVGASVAEEVETSKDGVDWRKLGAAIFTGVAVSVGTTLVLDWVKGKDLWADSGSLPTRLKQAFQDGVTLLPQAVADDFASLGAPPAALANRRRKR